MDGNKSIEPREFLSPLLSTESQEYSGNDGVVCEEKRQKETWSVPPILILTTLVAVSGSYVFGSAVGYSSPAQTGIMDDLNLGVAEYSLFGSILTIGAMIGAIVSGRIADYAGRRAAMGFSEVFCILGWLAIAFSKVGWWLYVGRLLVGCGMGLLSYVVPVYVAEITPKNLRGGFTTVHQLMICCGVSLTYLIGAFLNWRILAIIGTIPCLVQLLGLFFIPESPRWLAKFGHWEWSESVLQRLRGKNADVSQEATEIRDFTEALQRQTEASIVGLFQLQYLKSLTVGVGLMILQQFGGVNGIAFYASSIFISAGFSGSIGMIAMVAVQIPMTTLGVLLMDKSGRRPLLLISASGTCLGCFLAALSFFLQDLQKWKEVSPILALVGVLVYTGSFSLGMGGIPWVIMSEIFPINVKGSAGSLVTLVSWLCSWIVSYAFNFLMSWSSAVLPAMINLFLKRNTSTDTCHHHHYHHSVLGLGLATRDVDRPPNVLESAMLRPNAPPAPAASEKRVIGSVDDDVVNGLTSCTESLGFESSDEIHSNNNCDEKENNYDEDGDGIWRRRMMKAESRGKVRSFPPPLPSLNRNGKPSFYLRPVRKDGRLELTEVRIQRSEILHASRHNGRLTLHLVPDLEDMEEEEEEELEEEIEEEKIGVGVGEWRGLGGSEGLRRCHEMVSQHHGHHHHHHVHGNLRMCGISIV
ncbi:Sugar transporter ERD6 5 [Spatholobus suberectus]|nr:Sugar transporter ERD6 5 [Spatholobus suberectus]